MYFASKATDRNQIERYEEEKEHDDAEGGEVLSWSGMGDGFRSGLYDLGRGSCGEQHGGFGQENLAEDRDTCKGSSPSKVRSRTSCDLLDGVHGFVEEDGGEEAEEKGSKLKDCQGVRYSVVTVREHRLAHRVKKVLPSLT
jgi:hypothetical protein